MKKTVFIHAYAAGNLGDDLMMRILCMRYPQVQFRLYADESYKRRFRDIKNLKVYSPTDKKVIRIDYILNKVKKTERGMWKLLIKTAHAVVHIGGSVFTQHEEDYSNALHLDQELVRLSKRIYVVGANFGPYTSEAYVKDYGKHFQKYQDICFRDRYSYELFRSAPNVRYAPDVVFNLPLNCGGKQKKQVLFSVIQMEDRGGKYAINHFSQDYFAFILRLMREFIKRGYRIKLISFCSFQQDDVQIQRLLGKLTEAEREETEVCLYEEDEKSCLQAFYESELVVGTRFHSIILGWMAEKRVLPIVYDSKTLHTLLDNEVSEYLTLDMIQGMKDDEVITWAERLIQSRPLEVSELKVHASEQFSALDLFLK